MELWNFGRIPRLAVGKEVGEGEGRRGRDRGCLMSKSCQLSVKCGSFHADAEYPSPSQVETSDFQLPRDKSSLPVIHFTTNFLHASRQARSRAIRVHMITPPFPSKIQMHPFEPLRITDLPPPRKTSLHLFPCRHLYSRRRDLNLSLQFNIGVAFLGLFWSPRVDTTARMQLL